MAGRCSVVRQTYDPVVDVAASARAWIDAWTRSWHAKDPELLAPVYAEDAVFRKPVDVLSLTMLSAMVRVPEFEIPPTPSAVPSATVNPSRITVAPEPTSSTREAPPPLTAREPAPGPVTMRSVVTDRAPIVVPW